MVCMMSTVIVYVQQPTNKTRHSAQALKRSDFHLSESQRVIAAGPVIPDDAISDRRVSASQIATVQVGVKTCTVPPGTFVPHCT